MPYYTKEPKGDHSFDNHPYTILVFWAVYSASVSEEADSSVEALLDLPGGASKQVSELVYTDICTYIHTCIYTHMYNIYIYTYIYIYMYA